MMLTSLVRTEQKGGFGVAYTGFCIPSIQEVKAVTVGLWRKPSRPHLVLLYPGSGGRGGGTLPFECFPVSSLPDAETLMSCMPFGERLHTSQVGPWGLWPQSKPTQCCILV